MELNGAKILYTIHTDIPLLGDFKITQTLVSTWIVMALLSGFAIWLGSNLKLENVSKRQAAAEFIVERLDQFVHDNMGYHFDKYIPLIGAIFAPLRHGVRLPAPVQVRGRPPQRRPPKARPVQEACTFRLFAGSRS